MTDKTIFRLNPAKNPFLGNLPESAMEDLMARAQVQELDGGAVFIRDFPRSRIPAHRHRSIGGQ